MVRKTRQFFALAVSALCCLAVVAVTSLGQSGPPQGANEQKFRQQVSQAATEELVHRIGTMLRVMEYYQPDKAAQRSALDNVAKTLSGLSREQMDDILKRLDKAATEPDAVKSANEIEKAHTRHLEVMVTLRELLAQYAMLNSLDQLAERLDKLARSELDLALVSSKFVKDDKEGLPNYDTGFRGKGGGGLSPQQVRNLEYRQLSVEQNNIREDFDKLLKKSADLQALLPFEQRDVLHQLNQMVDELRVNETLTDAYKKLENLDNLWGADQSKALVEANVQQRKGSDDLMDLASLLRQYTDPLVAMRKAQEQLDETIRQQMELQDKARLQAEKDSKDPSRPQPAYDNFPQFGGKKGGFGGRESTAPPMASDRGAKEMSDQQARLALDTRDTSNLLKPISVDLADKIDTSRTPMKNAEELLRDATPNKAVVPQDKVIDTLKEARAELALMIAKAEEQRRDPLAALKDIAENLEKILKEQIATRDLTRDTGDAKQLDKLPDIAPQQKDLAKRTDVLNSKPMPNRDQTQKALDNASKSMTSAAKNLQDQKATDSVAKQDDAIKSLEEAKKSIDQQIAEIEKRREDIAKLEDAAQKLDKLTRDEAKIADEAAARTAQPNPNTKNLSQQQDKLTPQAKDIAKNLDKIVPKAADKVNQGAVNMDQAMKELAKNLPQPGADEANKAVDRLKEALDELNRKLDELKTKELIDQAKMKNLDPATLAQQLQKAIDQTKQAMKQSEKAQNMDLQKTLADQQKQIADQAMKMKLDKAANPAYDAAKSLQKGDLKKALDQQKQTLDKLQQAAKAKSGDKGDKGKGDKGDKGKGDKGDKGDKGQGGAGDPDQLAQQQKDLMDLVKQLSQQQAQDAQKQARRRPTRAPCKPSARPSPVCRRVSNKPCSKRQAISVRPASSWHRATPVRPTSRSSKLCRRCRKP